MALSKRREAAQIEGNVRTVGVCLLLYAVLAMPAPWNQTPLIAADAPVLPTYDLYESAFTYLRKILRRRAASLRPLRLRKTAGMGWTR